MMVVLAFRNDTDCFGGKHVFNVSVTQAYPPDPISCRDLCDTINDYKNLYPLGLNDWPPLLENNHNKNIFKISHALIRRGLYCQKAISCQNNKLSKAYEIVPRQRLTELGGGMIIYPKSTSCRSGLPMIIISALHNTTTRHEPIGQKPSWNLVVLRKQLCRFDLAIFYILLLVLLLLLLLLEIIIIIRITTIHCSYLP